MYSVMWSEHCSYKSSKLHLRQFGEKTTDAMREHLLAGMGENAGVVDIGDGWAVTFKVESPQPPELRRALPGRGHRRRRDRAGHHGDGRAPGRRDGPAAVRRDRPPRHRARRARRGLGRRRLRQLPRPAQHRRRGGVRRRVPGQPAGQRAVPGRAAARRAADRRAPAARATRSSCSGPAPVATGSAARRSSRARRSTTPSRPSGPASRWATRSWRRCSSSAASSCSRPGWSRASRTSARPASRARPARWPRQATAACTSTWRTCCCGTRP